ELRRFVPRPDGGPAALESMAFLRGSAIEVDAQRAVISTPSPGLLLIEDRRTESDDGRAGALGDMRGTSVFEWNGAMRLDRSTGEGQMTQGVRVRHRHPGGATTTELECERLNIRLAESPAGSTQDAVRLESAQ